LAANASDPQPLAAVTRKKQWQMATSELRHGHQFAAQGYFAPLGHLQVSMVRRSRSAIPTKTPKAKSANPITGGWLQGACCFVLGPRSTRRSTECKRAAYKHNGRCALHVGLSTGARLRRACSVSQTLISSTGGKRRTSWQPSAMQRRLDVGFGVN
jgi:hypothetical protein